MNKIVVLGVDGFPYGGARIEKLKLIGKSLLLAGHKVHYVSKCWGVLKKGDLAVKGEVEGLTYNYTCFVTYRPVNFFVRRLVKLIGSLLEVIYLLTHQYDAAIVSVASGDFFSLINYRIISLIKGYRIYYPHHEDVSLYLGEFFARLNSKLFEKYAFHCIDGAFPITTFLERKIQESNVGLPLLKLPALVAFDCFDNCKCLNNNDEKYFLYCGSLYYADVIEFIIQSFEKTSSNSFKLFLVCSGPASLKEQLQLRIAQSNKANLIKHFGFIEYSKLVELYVNAYALLIPLRNTIQDIARFPHKFAEYTASKRPIISNPVGDIATLFQHEESIVFVEKYEVSDFAKAMDILADSPLEAGRIGINGYRIGRKIFDYRSYSEAISQFILNRY